jgi:hypothetical protein
MWTENESDGGGKLIRNASNYMRNTIQERQVLLLRGRLRVDKSSLSSNIQEIASRKTTI